MTKFKTNEEYILNELYKAQSDLELANKKIEELEERLDKPTNDENMNCIYLSDKPYYYYNVNVSSAYNWNKILKSNKKTPKFVEEALEDEKKFKRLCLLKEKDNMWGSQIGEVDERLYNYLLKDRKDRYSVIVLSSDHTYLYNVKENGVFLNKEDAEAYRDERVRKEIADYLKHYKERFEETK